MNEFENDEIKERKARFWYKVKQIALKNRCLSEIKITSLLMQWNNQL